MKLIESIRFENGKFENLSFHQQRLNNARIELFGINNKVDLLAHFRETLFKNNIPKRGLFKCRIIYAEKIEKTELIPYRLPSVKSLKLVLDDEINYRYKYLDRSNLEKLYKQKDDCDDIIIVKNNLITDSFNANLIFYNGKEWITPEKPLLKGTRREQLLSEEKIKTADIRVADLKHFSKVRLINAMIRFEDEIETSTSNIII